MSENIPLTRCEPVDKSTTLRPGVLIVWPTTQADHWLPGRVSKANNMGDADHPKSNLSGFGAVLRAEMQKHGDTPTKLVRALREAGTPISVSQLAHWLREKKLPYKLKSHLALHSIEARYGLPHAYFTQILFATSGRISSFAIKDVPHKRLRRYACHLPGNFLELPVSKQAEIKAWVMKNIFYNDTEFRKYQVRSVQGSFSLRLLQRKYQRKSSLSKQASFVSSLPNENAADAPALLMREVDALVAFKTATLPPAGVDRDWRWTAATAQQKRIYLGLLFGALVSSPDSDAGGLGVLPDDVSVALLVFPSIWDWYLSWRERRRGFFTAWETNMVGFARHLMVRETGWIRQNEWLSSHLKPIPGLVSQREITVAQNNWGAACDKMELHAQRRIRALNAVARVHRDSFEQIEPVLAAKSPLGEYRKITKEIMFRVSKGGLTDYDEEWRSGRF
jgi:hypothetical protein